MSRFRKRYVCKRSYSDPGRYYPPEPGTVPVDQCEHRTTYSPGMRSRDFRRYCADCGVRMLHGTPRPDYPDVCGYLGGRYVDGPGAEPGLWTEPQE